MGELFLFIKCIKIEFLLKIRKTKKGEMDFEKIYYINYSFYHGFLSIFLFYEPKAPIHTAARYEAMFAPGPCIGEFKVKM